MNFESENARYKLLLGKAGEFPFLFRHAKSRNLAECQKVYSGLLLSNFYE